jgi:hypothetical protein
VSEDRPKSLRIEACLAFESRFQALAKPLHDPQVVLSPSVLQRNSGPEVFRAFFFGNIEIR